MPDTSLDSLTFNGFIPSLRHLLPKQRGIPGFVYCQVAVENIRRAQNHGWKRVEHTLVYTISGPTGDVDCELYCRGKRIMGQSHDSGRRRCFVDKLIRAKTGLSNGLREEDHVDAKHVLETPVVAGLGQAKIPEPPEPQDDLDHLRSNDEPTEQPTAVSEEEDPSAILG